MNHEIARNFLARSFRPGETIALLLRREDPVKVSQSIVTLDTAMTTRYMAWLGYENHNGANVYVAANPLRPGSRKRTKESIAEVRYLYIDIDMDGDERLAAIRASDAAPSPSAILATSPGKYQVLWLVEGFDFEQQETMLKQLAIAFGGHPACTDRNRVLRLPGFSNCKYGPPFTVAAEYPSEVISYPENFRLNTEGVEVARIYIYQRKQQETKTHFEQDWAWVLAELSAGTDAEIQTQLLAYRRTDKANPLYYAQRTVDLASARLCLSSGAAIVEVIAVIEDRRRLVIPASLCSARAREIAHTAQRMIARKQFA
jgi:hypothetical protein